MLRVIKLQQAKDLSISVGQLSFAKRKTVKRCNEYSLLFDNQFHASNYCAKISQSVNSFRKPFPRTGGFRCYMNKRLILQIRNEAPAEEPDYKCKRAHRWTTDDIAKWAQIEVKFDEADMAKLKEMKMDGFELRSITKQELINAGIPLGSVIRLLWKYSILIKPAASEVLSRNAPEYQYLTSEATMTASIGTFMPLPIELKLPVKGYLNAHSIFITAERVKLWKMYFDINSTSNKQIVVPSGPYGIGKSGVGYLIALTAYFLKKPLFYFPNSKLLTKEKIEDMFIFWNKDLMETNPYLEEILSILRKDDTIGASRFWEAFSSLPGAVIIFNEHNELYKMQSNSWYNMFTSFQTFQAANFVSFIGTTLSQFDSMPDGYNNSLTYLTPLTRDEMKLFITAPGSPLSTLEWDKIPGTTKEAKLGTIYSSVGGVYCQLVELHHYLKMGSFNNYIKSLTDIYHQCLVQLNRKFKGEDKQMFLDLLKAIANQDTKGVACIEASMFLETSALYDCGMLYVTEDLTILPLNKTAINVIRSAIGNHSSVDK